MPQRVFVRSGRAAIALALKALKIGTGDRVLVPTYHCPTMIAPIVAAGASLSFFPIEASGAPCLPAIEALSRDGVRAMLAAHYFGLPQSLAAVRSFCDRHGIALIEDCAHALFGFADGHPIGASGDFAIASLTKFLPVTSGGCLASARRPIGDELLEPRRRSLRDEMKEAANSIELGAFYGSSRVVDPVLRASFRALNALRGRGGIRPAGETREPHDADHWIADIVSLRSLGMAATRFSRWVARHADRVRIVESRRRNYERLSETLTDLPGAKPLFSKLPADAAPYVFPLWVAEPDRHYQAVRRSGIPIFRWDEVWPSTPRFEADVGLDWARSVFQLGCHQDLAREDIDAISATLRRVFASAGG